METYFGLRDIDTTPAPGFDGHYIRVNHDPVYLRGGRMASRQGIETSLEKGINLISITSA